MLGEKLVSLNNFKKEEEIESTRLIHVFKGIDLRTNEPVAINEYSLYDFNSQIQAKFLNRVQALSKLSHPAVEQLVGFTLPNLSKSSDLKSEPPAIITKFTQLGTLKTKEKAQLSWFIPSQQMILMYGIASGLKYLHSQGIVHGSLDTSKIAIDQKFEPMIIGVSSY